MPWTGRCPVYDPPNTQKLIFKTTNLPYPQSNIPETDIEPRSQPASRCLLTNLPGRYFEAHCAFCSYVCLRNVCRNCFCRAISGHRRHLEMWPQGALFAALLLGFLATHEFGHYFAAVYHKVGLPFPTSFQYRLELVRWVLLSALKSRFKAQENCLILEFPGQLRDSSSRLGFCCTVLPHSPIPHLSKILAVMKQLLNILNKQVHFQMKLRKRPTALVLLL